MDRLIEQLALWGSLDDLCEKNDIDKCVVLRFLIDEDLIDISEYLEEEQE